MGDVCEEVSGNNGNVKGLPILTISAANGWMNQKDRFSQVIAGNELKKYTLLEKGHLAYNHGNSKLAKYGTVFVQNLYDQALVPRVYHSFKMKTENNPYYIEYYFATKKLDRELARLVTSGARMDGLLNINKKDFFKIKFEVPTPVEQSLISTILQKLDQTITLHEEKKRQLEHLKSALLQKMFADKSGCPLVRFKEFDEMWEYCKLEEVFVERNQKEVADANYPLCSFIAHKGVVPKDKYDRSFLVKSDGKKYKRTEFNDFIYSSNNLETGSIGLNKFGRATISPVYSIFMVKGDSNFIAGLASTPRFIYEMIRFRQGVVYGRWRIHESDFLKIKYYIPQVTEQEKIGNLLS